MHKHPSLQELVTAVKTFIDDTATPNLTGHAGFHARVASNVLATVIREFEHGPDAERDELARLIALLEPPTSADTEGLNRQLCERIRQGELTISTPGLLTHLKSTAIAQLDIDQPRYSGRKRLS
ncbi:MAG: DUF6285 domain-containing protein [Pseudomonadota bacterium]